jgi:hypothetical protein
MDVKGRKQSSNVWYYADGSSAAKVIQRPCLKLIRKEVLKYFFKKEK